MWLCFLVWLLSGCGQPRQIVHLVGSETVLPLATVWAEAFEHARTDALVTTTGGGSTVGWRMLREGVADVAMASRPVGMEEAARARSAGVSLTPHLVARDAVVVVVHPGNPVPYLSYRQLRDIYLGRVRNWRQVGGPDRPVRAITRSRGSGTAQTFIEKVFAGPEPYREQVEGALGNGMVYADVAADPAAIGYIGFAFVRAGVRAVPLAVRDDMPPVAPTWENITGDRYDLVRTLLLYTNGEPSGITREFLDFCQSPEGQRIAQKWGYIPLAGR